MSQKKKESTMLKSLLTLTMIFMLAACSSDDDDKVEEMPVQFTASQTFEITLSGNQQVPMNGSMQTTTATIELDENLMQIRAELDVSAVSGFSAAHIHSGAIGQNGEVVFATTDGSYAGTGVDITSVTDEQITALMSGQWYVNLHTNDFPDGELRGQIVNSDTSIITFKLSGSQEVPAIDSDAMGYGYATYNHTSMEVVVRAVTMGLEDATAAHIHTGDAGTNGNVFVGLLQSTEDMNTWATPDETIIDAETFTTLMAGGHYVNVHTPAHPSGELRGQILTDNFRLYAFKLTGEQEVPAIMTSAFGDGYALVNKDNFALEIMVITSGVEDATAAHIHTGNEGENGGVLAPLEQSANDPSIWMTASDLMIDADTYLVLANGGHYINVHTPLTPSGEIRGQIK